MDQEVQSLEEKETNRSMAEHVDQALTGRRRLASVVEIEGFVHVPAMTRRLLLAQ
jgi:hypothetical protein